MAVKCRIEVSEDEYDYLRFIFRTDRRKYSREIRSYAELWQNETGSRSGVLLKRGRIRKYNTFEEGFTVRFYTEDNRCLRAFFTINKIQKQ